MALLQIGVQVLPAARLEILVVFRRHGVVARGADVVWRLKGLMPVPAWAGGLLRSRERETLLQQLQQRFERVQRFDFSPEKF